MTATFVGLVGIEAYRVKQHSPPIIYVLPAGFRGEFSVKVDPSSEWKRDAGCFLIEVSATGDAFVPDSGPLEAWHSDQPRFSDGNTIPVDGRDKMGRNGEGFYHLGSYSNGANWFLIGTREDYDQANSDEASHARASR